MTTMTNSSKPKLHPSWLAHLEDYFHCEEMKQLKVFLVKEQQNYRTFPPNRFIFAALNSTPLEQVRVVILGQDPYHGPGQAHGLSFSVPKGVRPPPSLINIFRELQQDVELPLPNHGDLTAWTKQGVLLLNTSLTVRERQANSHRGKGWEGFTNEIMKVVNREQRNVVFILWGKQAREKKSLIDQSKHLIIESAHPSPYSAEYGFFGSRPFSRTNHYLQSKGYPLINWSIT